MRYSTAVALVAGVSLGFAAAQAEPTSPAPLPKGIIYSDSLLPNAARPADKPLDKTDVIEGGAKWVATKEVIIKTNGATANAASGAHLPIPVIAGKIHIEADVFPSGSGFTGLALGRGNLSNNFWQNLSLMLTVLPGGRYNIFAANKNLLTTSDKTLVRPDGPNHVELTLNTMARTVTVRINGKTALEDSPLPIDANLDQITAAGFRFNEPVTAGEPVVSNFRVEVSTLAATGFEPVNIGMCFVVPDEKSTLSWRVTSPGPTREVPYIIKDYSGTQVDSGTATQSDDGIVSLTRAFPRGYAEVVFPAANQTFGVVSLEPQVGDSDPFFCIDAALTWLELDPARRNGLVKIMARSGIAMARERFPAVFTATPGTYDWDASARKGETLRQTYADSKVPVLDILGRDEKNFGLVKGQVFPQNLPVIASEWSGVARHWNSVWGGAEVYNEPDLKPAPADQYAPMVKAMSYALSEAKCTAPLVTGVFATSPPGPYFDTCTANDILKDSDVVSFHAYDQAPDIEQVVTHFRDWLKKSNVEAMPLWISECGKAWVKGLGRPPQDQDAISACEISAMSAEARACGIARYFPFVFVYYEEGAKNFGMMGREATPLRSMAAYAQCIRALSGKQYLGDLQGISAPVKLARVFGADSGGECVAVLYTGTLDATATVPFPLKIKRIAGADGRALQPVDGNVPIPDGLTYVWIDSADLGSSLNTATRASELYKIGQTPLKQKRLASPIVLQFLAQNTPSRASARRYLITQELAHELPLSIRIHNLSQTAINVTPELTLPGGSPDKKEPVSVPPMGYIDIAWKIDASQSLDIAQTRLITVTAKSSGEIQPTPLAIPMTMEGTLKQHLARYKNKTPLPITELSNWRPNVSSGRSKFSVTPEGIWRMDIVLTGNRGGWAYPRFTMPAKLDPQADNGFLIRARVVKSGRPNLIVKTGVNGQGGVPFWVPDIFPGDGEWHVVYIPFAEFKPGPGSVGNQNTRLDPASWKIIEIGMGSGGLENAFEISHFLLVGGTGGD